MGAQNIKILYASMVLDGEQAHWNRKTYMLERLSKVVASRSVFFRDTPPYAFYVFDTAAHRPTLEDLLPLALREPR